MKLIIATLISLFAKLLCSLVDYYSNVNFIICFNNPLFSWRNQNSKYILQQRPKFPEFKYIYKWLSTFFDLNFWPSWIWIRLVLGLVRLSLVCSLIQSIQISSWAVFWIFHSSTEECIIETNNKINIIATEEWIMKANKEITIAIINFKLYFFWEHLTEFHCNKCNIKFHKSFILSLCSFPSDDV